MPQTLQPKRPSTRLAALHDLLFRRLPARRRALGAIAAALLALVLLLALFLRPAAKEDYAVAAYTAKKSDLVVSVLEGGSLAATNSQDIKCAVEGQTTIISVVPDGYIITEQDVKDGKVLLELDSSKLREQAIQQDITFQDASAAFTQAQEQLEIQKNQNESDISAAELQLRFARMDLEKYLGTELTAAVADKKVDIGPLITGRMNPTDASEMLRKINVGGAAWQSWENLRSAIDLAGAGFYSQITSYQWSRKLGPKIAPDVKLIADADQIVAQKLGQKWPDETVTGEGYIQRTDVETDALTLKTKLSAMEQADLALAIFLQYDFAKQASTFLSAHTEAGRQLERTKAKATSALVMAEKNLRTREESLKIQSDHNDRVNKQLAACTVRAAKPGMVVYSSTSDPWRRGQDKIEEGALVRERQVILSIPDPSGMEVTVRVHEASVDKIKPGQRTKIIVDAFPDITLWGVVTKIARMPERPNWMSPDLKVYSATVAVKDAPPTLKVGMSAQAEIMVDTVTDALVVPMQAVSNYNGRRICYVLAGDAPQPRLVETGEFNEKFIQILEGVKEGEKVLLHQPTMPDSVLAKLVPKAPEKPKVGSSEVAAKEKAEAAKLDPKAPEEQKVESPELTAKEKTEAAKLDPPASGKDTKNDPPSAAKSENPGKSGVSEAPAKTGGRNRAQ